MATFRAFLFIEPFSGRNGTAKIHSRRAFTLIELLVVISIIGLLVSILVPTLTKAKEAAKRTACRTNLHAVAVGLRMYLDQFNDTMPIAAAKPSLHLNNDPPIATVLRSFLSDSRALQCPSDTVVKYYLTELSSYEYNARLSGEKVDSSFLKRIGERNVWVMKDYDPFHGPAGALGACNFVFADQHVGDMERS